jgi:CRP/FNR family transcriptional regulator
MDHIQFKSFDSAGGLSAAGKRIDGTDMLKITHEKIANHMGTAREVVTRMRSTSRRRAWSS